MEVSRAEVQSTYGGALIDSLNARNRRFLALEPLLVDGSTAASTTASLAGLISGAAAVSNVRLGTVQVSTDSNPKHHFSRLTVRAQATGDVRGLTALLANLEGGPTLLRITDFQVTQLEPGAPSDRGESLQLSLTAHGLALLRRGKSQ